MARFIVCGGRDYTDRARVFEALDRACVTLDLSTLVHGACPTGADRWADEWARERGIPCERFPADWKTYGRGAGMIRNRAMAQAGADGLIAFPGGVGTADMMRQAKRAGITVWSIPPRLEMPGS